MATVNSLGLHFLTDIVTEAQYDLACAVDVQHWWRFSRRLPFPRPSDRLLRSCRHVPWQEERGEVLILVDGFVTLRLCMTRLDFAPARAIKVVLIIDAV